VRHAQRFRGEVEVVSVKQRFSFYYGFRIERQGSDGDWYAFKEYDGKGKPMPVYEAMTQRELKALIKSKQEAK
jgi:hypothetical protein